LRKATFEHADFCARFDDYMIAFAWCYAKANEHPEMFDMGELLNYYANVPSRSLNFTAFRREQYAKICKDVEAKLKIHGHSPRHYLIESRSACADLGRRPMARALHAKLESLRDWPTLDPHYEAARQIEFHSFLGEYDQCVRIARDWYIRNPDVQSGWIAGESLLPLLRIGDVAQAMQWHQATWRWIGPGQGYFWAWGPTISFNALTGNFRRAISLFQKMSPWALSQRDELSRFHFLENALVLLSELIHFERKTIATVLPKEIDIERTGKSIEVDVLFDWIYKAIQRIADSADERNGNKFFSRQVRAMLDMGDQFRCEYPIE
jgi:hypothetical protein